MACFGEFLRGLWSILIGSVRIFLFLLCLVLALVLSLFIFSLVHFDTDLNIALPNAINCSHYIHSVALLAIALLGCCASFLGHNTSLRTFAVLCIVYALVLIVNVHSNMRPGSLEEINKEFVARMKGYAPHYDWIQDAPPGKVGPKEREATRAWDAVQGLFCCGIHGPKDWDELRPSEVDDDFYPSSCCFDYEPHPMTGKRLCSKKTTGVFTTGCLEAVEQFEEFYLNAYNFSIFFPILLSALACVVSYLRCNRPDYQGRVLNRVRILNEPPLAYQRVDHVMTPVMTQQGDIYKQQQWMYPNAYSVEHNGPYAPPPSYGSTQR